MIRAHDRRLIAEEMVTQCEALQDRFALLAVESAQDDIAAIRPFRDTAFAALYYPWIRIKEPGFQRYVWAPAIGHVAGIFARCDSQRVSIARPRIKRFKGSVELTCSS